MRNIIMFASLCALSACATPRLEIVQPPVSAGVIQGVSTQRIANSTQMTVRTLTVQDGETVEVSGLSCNLRSDELSANFTSPAYVNVPRFVQSARFANRGRPTPLLIRCEGGELTGVVSVDGEDKRIGTATNAGIGGAILTTLVTAAVASSTPWKFPENVNVTVE
jgi:hypothetical protein